jgi:hypothetical protein
LSTRNQLTHTAKGILLAKTLKYSPAFGYHDISAGSVICFYIYETDVK